MKAYTLIFGLFLSVLISGCERAADVKAPQQYDHARVRFAYPGNWKVTDDTQGEHHRYIFIESPGSAIFVVHIYPKDDAASLDEFASWFSAAASEEMPMVDFANSTFSSVEKLALGTDLIGKKEEFSVTLLGEELPHTREYFTRDAGDRVAYMITQTANEDSGKVSPGFDLLLGSFTLE